MWFKCRELMFEALAPKQGDSLRDATHRPGSPDNPNVEIRRARGMSQGGGFAHDRNSMVIDILEQSTCVNATYRLTQSKFSAGPSSR
jgi:hypothetical protein